MGMELLKWKNFECMQIKRNNNYASKDERVDFFLFEQTTRLEAEFDSFEGL